MRNRGIEWSDEDLRRLRDLAAAGTPTGVIALRLDRSKVAVYSKAAKEHITLSAYRGLKKTKQAVVTWKDAEPTSPS